MDQIKEKIIRLLMASPGLTGRLIANEIGMDKKELNSFLYSNSEGLIQKDWKWYLAGSQSERKTVVVNISNISWLDADTFESDLTSSGEVFLPEVDDVILRFPQKCRILLIAGARIIGLANQAAHFDKKVLLDFTQCPTTKNYLDRLGFFDHLAPSVNVLPERPERSKAKKYSGNSENLVEIASIDLDNFDFDLPQKLTKQFALHAGQEYYVAAFSIFSELIGNVQEHSETPIPGFASLQLYGGNRKHIQTVICDSGHGIGSTLKRNLDEHYPKLAAKLDLASIDSDVSLVKQVLTKGGLSQFGSHPDRAARGLGISRTQSYAAKYDAVVHVRQPTYELKLIYEDGKLKTIQEKRNLTLLHGTQVCFDFYISYA